MKPTIKINTESGEISLVSCTGHRLTLTKNGRLMLHVPWWDLWHRGEKLWAKVYIFGLKLWIRLLCFILGEEPPKWKQR